MVSNRTNDRSKTAVTVNATTTLPALGISSLPLWNRAGRPGNGARVPAELTVCTHITIKASSCQPAERRFAKASHCSFLPQHVVGSSVLDTTRSASLHPLRCVSTSSTPELLEQPDGHYVNTLRHHASPGSGSAPPTSSATAPPLAGSLKGKTRLHWQGLGILDSIRNPRPTLPLQPLAMKRGSLSRIAPMR